MIGFYFSVYVWKEGKKGGGEMSCRRREGKERGGGAEVACGTLLAIQEIQFGREFSVELGR